MKKYSYRDCRGRFAKKSSWGDTVFTKSQTSGYVTCNPDGSGFTPLKNFVDNYKYSPGQIVEYDKPKNDSLTFFEFLSIISFLLSVTLAISLNEPYNSLVRVFNFVFSLKN